LPLKTHGFAFHPLFHILSLKYAQNPLLHLFYVLEYKIHLKSVAAFTWHCWNEVIYEPKPCFKRFKVCVLEGNGKQSDAHVGAIKLLHLRTLEYLLCQIHISKWNFSSHITYVILKMGTIKFPWSLSVFVVSWPDSE